jgi:hypothetical protein
VLPPCISVTELVEPLGSTLYLFGQLRSFGLVGNRYTSPLLYSSLLLFPLSLGYLGFLSLISIP